jgi:hypothetical protein
MDKQAQADQAHAKFDDEKEFVGYLKLWKWLGDCGGHDAAISSTASITKTCYATTSSTCAARMATSIPSQ